MLESKKFPGKRAEVKTPRMMVLEEGAKASLKRGGYAASDFADAARASGSVLFDASKDGGPEGGFELSKIVRLVSDGRRGSGWFLYLRPCPSISPTVTSSDQRRDQAHRHPFGSHLSFGATSSSVTGSTPKTRSTSRPRRYTKVKLISALVTALRARTSSRRTRTRPHSTSRR